MATIITVNVLLLVISTAALAGALLFTGEEINADTLLKCLGINVAVLLVSFVPVVGFISGVIWLAALMSVFEKSFREALLVSLVCLVITVGAGWGLGLIFGSQTTTEQPTLVIHVHDSTFDLIDHSGSIVKTTESVEETVAAIGDPSISTLITNGSVKLRTKLRSGGIPEGDAGELAGKLMGVVRSVEFENSPSTKNN